MKKLFPLFVIFSIVWISSQVFAENGSKNNSSNKVLIEKEMQPFTQLVVAGVFNVELSYGDTEKVIIDTHEDLLQYIEIRNEKGKLFVKTDDHYKKTKGDEIKIFIVCKELSLLKIAGVGNVVTENLLKSTNLELQITGVGRTALEIEAKQIKCNISAVGDVSLSGKANDGTISISGVGNFDASKFVVNALTVTNSGVGQVQVHAVDELNLKSTGIGKVKYFGNPQKENISNSGLGKVEKGG